jgi:transcription elongation factor Elf1
MEIKKIISQTRRDFTALYVCQHCGHEQTGSGYDDTYFHTQVIPNIKCGNCSKSGGPYVPREPKYPEGMDI